MTTSFAERAPAPAPFPTAVTAYAGAVGVAGLAAALVLLGLAPFGADLRHHPLELGALAAAVLLGELTAMAVPRGDGTTATIGISTVFAVALVLLGPLSFAVVASLLACALGEVRHRRPPLKVLFNCGQQALSLVVARLAYCAVSGVPVLGSSTPFSSSDLPAALAAGVAYAVVNGALVCVVVALAGGEPVLTALLHGQRAMLETSGLLAGLAPVVAVLVHESVLLLPLLLLPILAVARAALLAVEREKQSLHDPLTGLANRALLRLRLERALASASTPGIAVLMLDLDHFKDVNDTLGHSVGDDLLCAVAQRLTEVTRPAGERALVARLGGDEFAVLLVTRSPGAAALELAESLLDRFHQPVEVRGTRLAVRTSIGITSTDGARLADVPTALEQADTALYEAKRERARASVFSPGATPASSERVLLLPQLQEAVESRQLTVLYQPQVQVATGRVVAVEALVHWDHPARGRLGPSAFLDLAESAGLVPLITAFVLEEALAVVARWHARGWDVGASVDLSARELSDLALPDRVAALLHAAGVPASLLTVEVTESSLMADPRAARTILRTVRDTGVRLSVDDFGTGYSSLALLQQLDVDELKVDRSFVAGMASGGSDEVLVRSVIELAHNLGLSVVAEGVETAGTAEQLAHLGCDRLQGHLYGRPMAADAVEALLSVQHLPHQAAPS